MSSIASVLNQLGLPEFYGSKSTSTPYPAWATGSAFGGSLGPSIPVVSPVDGKEFARAGTVVAGEYQSVVDQAQRAFEDWRQVPAPKRGEIVRLLGMELRKYKDPLGRLVSYEMGKSLQEGWGEVQEMIDICDFAVGLSRQLYGLTMHSERPGHRMYEQWHPLGVVGIISAFNFPVAVWAWNSALAWVCGNACVWKPSEKAPMSALACHAITARVFKNAGLPEGLSCLVVGDAKVGKFMSADPRVPLVSATGSVRMGKAVAETVGARLGRSLLELGGNNAIIISDKADLDHALRGALFGAIGTAGQRCTSTRRLLIFEQVYDQFIAKLVKAYGQIKIGDPLDAKNHMGPLIDQDAVELYLKALARVKQEGGKLLVEGGALSGKGYESGCYVSPSIAEVAVKGNKGPEFTCEEVFAPLLYVMKVKNLDQAIAVQNSVPQGLSSAIMTLDLQEAERFLSATGSDCGIANVNIGTSGAEIGGAFGGEKETGGGRESGSDSWRAYMRRQTNTLNWSKELPLAQGIEFKL